MIYTVTLNPSVDYTVYTDELQFGQTNRSVREEIHFGGKGINVSRVLAELGISSTALGFTAGFTGRALEEDLRQRGIDARLIRLPEGFTRINIKLHTDVETEINGSGPPIPDAALEAFMAELASLTSDDTLVLAGSVPPSLPRDIYARILQAVSARKVRCAVDAAGQLLLEVLPYRPFLIKPNRQELEELFRVTLPSREEIVAYGAKLQSMGACNVLISLGSEGAVLLDERGTVHTRAAIPCQAVSTVGAGDSMLAGFLAGIDRTGEYAEALAMGTVCGAATASLPGLADRATIARLQSQISS